MSTFARDDASLYYEISGAGPPVLAIAPGGLRSTIEHWRKDPHPGATGPPEYFDPTHALAEHFEVIAMDQRNAGRSTAPVHADDGWDVYARDQLAVMDALGHERFGVIGMCMGASFALRLCALAPDRVVAAVLQNPIGRTEANALLFFKMFDGWAQGSGVAERTDAATLAEVARRLFGGEFVFSVDRAFVRTCATPLLVLPGGDAFHPAQIAEELHALAPNSRYRAEWSGVERQPEAAALVTGFLADSLNTAAN